MRLTRLPAIASREAETATPPHAAALVRCSATLASPLARRCRRVRLELLDRRRFAMIPATRTTLLKSECVLILERKARSVGAGRRRLIGDDFSTLHAPG